MTNPDWEYNEDDEPMDDVNAADEDCPDCEGTGYTQCPEMCGGDDECEMCNGGDEVECSCQW